MPRKPKDKRFATYAEEAAWWESNEEAFADAFEKSASDGHAAGGIVVITGESKMTKIRLSTRDVEKICRQANKRGMRSQEYLKSIFVQGIRKAQSEPL
jgi:hypothetical protein